MTRTTPAGRGPSANQQARRAEIVAATRTVLAEQGIAGCTERTIAAAAGLTKSALHYYFADLDDLIRQAMDAHVEALVARLGAAAAGAAPGTGLAALTDAYLAAFRAQPHAALLWFDFWVRWTRLGRHAELAAVEARLHELIAAMLRRDGHSGAPGVARDVYAVLIGSIVEQAGRPLPAARVRARVAALAGTGR